MQSSGSSWATAASATSTGSAPTRNRFALRTRSVALDHRVEAVRRDLADIRMAERVFAPHYAVPLRQSAGHLIPVCDVAGGTPISQLLPGEPFDVLEFTSTHAWGRSPIDGAVGFVDRGALIAPFPVSHVVTVRAATVHADAARTRPLPLSLPMGAQVAAIPAGAAMEVDGGYVAADSLTPLDSLAGDPVDIALRLKGIPAVPGGRSGDSVDAAGLVFLAHALTGEQVARFADLQAAGIGTPLAEGNPPRRGDLWYFADHVAMLVDADTVIHADGTVRCDPVAALDRFGPVLARRRPA